jgi:hypothetical protein
MEPFIVKDAPKKCAHLDLLMIIILLQAQTLQKVKVYIAVTIPSHMNIKIMDFLDVEDAKDLCANWVMNMKTMDFLGVKDARDLCVNKNHFYKKRKNVY